jgi:hypothetical protein
LLKEACTWAMPSTTVFLTFFFLLIVFAITLSDCRQGLPLTLYGATRALAGARIGLGLLPADRQAAAMPQAPVTAQVHQTLDVHGYFAAQVAFDRDFPDFRADALDFRLRQVANLGFGGHTGSGAYLEGTGLADAIDVRQAHPGVLLNRYVDSCNTSHSLKLLSAWCRERKQHIISKHFYR